MSNIPQGDSGIAHHSRISAQSEDHRCQFAREMRYLNTLYFETEIHQKQHILCIFNFSRAKSGYATCILN